MAVHKDQPEINIEIENLPLSSAGVSSRSSEGDEMSTAAPGETEILYVKLLLSS